jgi:hypothetical protein
MRTICGIDVTKLAKAPTADELGLLVAHMNSDEQAKFFVVLGEELRNCCGGREMFQWQYISDSIASLEEKLCDGSASQLINEIQCRLADSQKQVRDAA